MNKGEIKTLKNQVEYILENFPIARNNDKTLTIILWREFYPFITLTGQIDLNEIYNLPSQDGIKRIRAHIQNKEKRYPPTELKIAEARGWLERDWRRALGYSVEPAGQLKLNI